MPLQACHRLQSSKRNNGGVWAQGYIGTQSGCVTANTVAGQAFQDHIQLLGSGQDDSDSAASSRRIVVAAVKAIAKKASDRLDLIVTPARLEHQFPNDVRCDVGRDSVCTRSVAQG